jgi:hypothetical protein
LLTLGQAVGTSDPARAVELFDEAIDCAAAAENAYAASAAASARGTVLSEWGDNAAACRAMLESATRSADAGSRAFIAQSIWAVAAHLTLAGHHEPAAIVEGYARAVLGDYPGPGWTDELLDALAALPVQLGEENNARLAAQGAAMSDEQVIRFATEAVQRLFGPG